MQIIVKTQKKYDEGRSENTNGLPDWQLERKPRPSGDEGDGGGDGRKRSKNRHSTESGHRPGVNVAIQLGYFHPTASVSSVAAPPRQQKSQQGRDDKKTEVADRKQCGLRRSVNLLGP